MTDVTRILDRVEQGDRHAAEELLPLVYDELRKLAAQKLAQEKPGQTLDATALVHEAYLRLVENAKDESARASDRGWANRRHFFAAAAEAMRRILVENARRKGRVKHGGGRCAARIYGSTNSFQHRLLRSKTRCVRGNSREFSAARNFCQTRRTAARTPGLR